MDKLQNMTCFAEAATLDRFFEKLSNDYNSVCYGPRSVKYALDSDAVEVLLISDKLFRAKNVVMRKEYVAMVE